MDIKGVDLPHTDVITYSFPCTDLSLAGNCAGLEIGTRSGLLWEVKRILEELNSISKLPKFLIPDGYNIFIENVKNLLYNYLDNHKGVYMKNKVMKIIGKLNVRF